MPLFADISKATALDVLQQTNDIVVRRLSLKYGFDQAEALDFLSPTSAQKSKKHFTGYLLFSDSERSNVRNELAKELGPGQKVASTLVVKALGRRWKSLTKEERKSWNTGVALPQPKDCSDLLLRAKSLWSEVDADTRSEYSFTMV